MNELKVFSNNEFGEIRTLEKDNEIWFVGRDVATLLGYSNTRDAIAKHIDPEDKFDGVAICDSIGRTQNPIFINESGLYSLILSSKLPKAKEFKRWVTSEVIPSIRKHGAYMTPDTIEQAISNPDFIIKLATELKSEQEKRKQLEVKVEADRPKVVFAECVETSNTSILVGELAKLLCQNGISIGGNRLFEWLRGKGYLISRKGTDYNMPTQYSMELGLFEIKETTANTPNGSKICKTPKVTGKGQTYFINKFMKMKEVRK